MLLSALSNYYYGKFLSLAEDNSLDASGADLPFLHRLIHDAGTPRGLCSDE
jgi:hypothetical protein